MAQRSAELIKLGQLLRDIAREFGVAIVVANQVADRFTGGSARASPMIFSHTRDGNMQGSPLARTREGNMQDSPLAKKSLGMNGGPLIPSNSTPMPSIPGDNGGRISSQKYSTTTPDPMSLDHQQRWFTGWGDDPHPSYTSSKNVKTPSLGLIWTTQIACRIALIKKPVYGRARNKTLEEGERGELVLRKWRRWMKIVFAGWAMESGEGLEGSVEFEIKGEGLFAVGKGDGVNGDNEGDVGETL